MLQVKGPKRPKNIIINNNDKGKIRYDINTTGKHGVPRETRVLRLLRTKISKIQALTIVSKISFSLAKEEKVKKNAVPCLI